MSGAAAGRDLDYRKYRTNGYHFWSRKINRTTYEIFQSVDVFKLLPYVESTLLYGLLEN